MDSLTHPNDSGISESDGPSTVTDALDAASSDRVPLETDGLFARYGKRPARPADLADVVAHLAPILD
ncbi:hypothetical protein CA983_33410 [Streptomyces swartbergensis]|uniref:Uncharacterized protein n=1 Tax=Streptomyces swartbergensis TaxID=487165 RepID=A0A243RKP4_9ACTN|nr:hypothetical protein CA983_33410 [Streptomyces swartbergensis]